MGRGGVTFSEVGQAALYLQDKGRTPTVDGVREYLGTGSRTTLAIHLKKWKDTQQDSTGHIPQQLMSVIAGLWDQLQEQANSKIVMQQTTFDADTAELKKGLREAQEHGLAQGAILSETQHQLNELRKETSLLSEKFRETSQSCERLGISHQTDLRQLEEARSENQRLHELAGRIQKNLEHYQDAIHQQKAEDSLRQEKQHAAFGQEISRLEQAFSETCKKLAESENVTVAHAREIAMQKTEYDGLRQKHDLLVKEYRGAENELLKLNTHHEFLLDQHGQLKKVFEQEHGQLQKVRQREAVLDNQIKSMEIALRKAEDKISTLQHENIFLKHEKKPFTEDS